jgi:hypothetical protein
LPPNRLGIPVKLVGIPVEPDCTAWFEFKFEFVRFPAGSRPNRTSKPVPDLAGSVRSVGIKNPARMAPSTCERGGKEEPMDGTGAG